MQETNMSKNTKEIDLKRSLSEAMALCYALRLDEAQSALDGIISIYPSAGDAYSALALIRFMQGRPDEQKHILKSSLKKNPSHYPSLHQMALVHYREGLFGDAYAYVQDALAHKPESETSLLLASRLCLILGNRLEAYQLAKTAVRHSNHWRPQASGLMAEALIDDKDPAVQLEKVIEAIIAGEGDDVKVEAATRLISAMQHDEKYSNLCAEQLTLDPDNKYLRLLRVKLISNRGQYDDCFPDLYYLLSLEQNNPAVLYTLAETLLALKKFREALQIYLRITRINGTDPLVLNQIGVCYRLMSRFRSAEKAYWRSIRLNPIDASLIGNLGEISFRFGDFKRSLDLYSIALNINPIYKDIFYNKMLGYSVGCAGEMSTMREEAGGFWATYRDAHAITKTTLADEKSSISNLAMHSTSTQIRIGILSSDIGNHCVSYFLTSFLRHYSRDHFNVELIMTNRRYEERERVICSYSDHALSLEGLSESAAREAIRSRHYDLILECNGYTGGSGISLLAERCAPIQCHYIGYHASTGLDTIDYFISDEHILSPFVTEQLSEKPLKLDRAWLAFSTFEAFPAAKSVAHAERPLLGFFGNSTKITDITLEYWSTLFLNCPNAVLVLKCLSYEDHYIARKVVNRIETRGIDRARIVLMEPSATWREHLECYNLIDYALDSTPWSSATTGFEALGMGVPLLAIQGETIAARMSSSLVHHLGRTEWLATSTKDYARFGERIANEFLQVRQQKEILQAEVQSSSLFDGPSLARSLEQALLRTLHSSRHA